MLGSNTSSVFSTQDWSPAGSVHAHEYKDDYNNSLNKHYQPLGRSYSHDHYIKPIPPMYVTEYEAAYTWPPVAAYSPTVKYNCFKDKKGIDIRGKRQWSTLQEVAHQLIDKGYEIHLLKLVLEQVEMRRFDSLVEYAYNHFLDVLKQVKQLLLSSCTSTNQAAAMVDSASIKNGIGSNDEVVRLDDAALTTMTTRMMPPDDVVELCKHFVTAIEAIKDA